MIGAMQTFCGWVKVNFFFKLVNFEGLQIGHQYTLHDGIKILIKVQIPPIKKAKVCKNGTENVEATSNTISYTFFWEKMSNLAFFGFLTST